MSDDLRTRIAKVLYGQILHPVPRFDDQPDGVKDAWLADADAVIRELGLHKTLERSEIVDRDGRLNIVHGRCRYITDWAEDE